MRRLAWIILLVSLVLAGAANWLNPQLFTERKNWVASGSGEALIGGEFDMVSHTGAAFTQEDLKGYYSLIYFGFTYCPDICPTTLLTVAETLDGLPESMRSQLLPVFVTVDPKRDTVEVMAQYVENFHPTLIGLTGSEAQVARMTSAYKVYYATAPSDKSDGSYMVDHSGYLYLMDPQGRYLAHFPHNVASQRLADVLRSHMLRR